MSSQLEHSGLGCHAGAFGYADDIALVGVVVVESLQI